MGQELMCGQRGRGRVDDTSFRAGARDQRVQLLALSVGGSVRRAFGRDPDAQSFRASPEVEQHAAQEEDLGALDQRPLAARTLCHLEESMGQ
jgi:hypothetical protein